MGGIERKSIVMLSSVSPAVNWILFTGTHLCDLLLEGVKMGGDIIYFLIEAYLT